MLEISFDYTQHHWGDTVNMFKAHLDKFWQHQQVVFDFKAELTGTGNRSEFVFNV